MVNVSLLNERTVGDVLEKYEKYGFDELNFFQHMEYYGYEFYVENGVIYMVRRESWT